MLLRRLQHLTSNIQAPYSYEAKFPVTLDSQSFERILIPFTEFKVNTFKLSLRVLEGQYPQAYFRGSVVEDAPPLDLAKVGVFGLQTFGGVYDEFKQAGVGALEIDFIALQ